MRHEPLLAAVLLLAGVCLVAEAQDWPTFGWDVGRSSAPNVAVGLSADRIHSLIRQQVALDGTVDASAIYLRGVIMKGSSHDAFFVTTTYGKTIALDADSGSTLWEYTPDSYDSLAGSYRITNATPVADDDREFVYAAAPDGVVRKLAVADGRVLWATAITRLPEREKIASPLSFFHGRVIAATDGYIGDRPPYQGHVAILDAASGSLVHVWNSLSSDRHELLDPAAVPESDSGIWGRAGVVIDSATGNLYVATGNGTWDGTVNWGDAVIELDPAAQRILGNYTPVNTADLNEGDVDLGSTSPVLLGNGLVAQGGKDRIIRVLDWRIMLGSAPHRGGEASKVSTPSGNRLFTAPALLHAGGTTWLFAADGGATSAWTLNGVTLQLRWQADSGGTSPVVADGMLFVYDPRDGLNVYGATTGRLIATLQCGVGHWNSPIVADGRIALPEGNANSHATSGVLDIWTAAYLVVPLPTAPTGVTAVQSGDQFQISWAPNGANPTAVVSSTLTATPVNSTASILTTTVGGSATSGLVGPLQPQTTYQITVVSSTVGGFSPASTAISVTTAAATVAPSAPTGVTASFTANYIPNWYVAVIAHNAAGWGPWSAVGSLGGLYRGVLEPGDTAAWRHGRAEPGLLQLSLPG